MFASFKKIISLAIMTVLLFGAASCSKDSNNLHSGESGGGLGGSTARFTIVGSYLYIVDATKIHTYNIAGMEPVLESTAEIGMDIETIFPYKNKLFIGSQAGMYILSIADPATPTMEGAVQHFRACDPVVADDHYAYVTLRTGTGCGGFISALEVYDISSIRTPVKVTQVDMENPQGLSLYGDALYVCNNEGGLRVFDVSTPSSPTTKRTFIDGRIYKDCIAYDNTLFCMISGGMAIYDISVPFEPVFITEV